MVCPPVRGDNPRVFANGLSYVQVDKHGIITILYHLHQRRPCTYICNEIMCAKVGNGGIKHVTYVVQPMLKFQHAKFNQNIDMQRDHIL